MSAKTLVVSDVLSAALLLLLVAICFLLQPL
jgi:hypothetical protein